MERCCKAFLWKGKNGDAKGAKANWDAVCLTKDEGGLGVKNLLNRNASCTMTFISLLFKQVGSSGLQEGDPATASNPAFPVDVELLCSLSSPSCCSSPLSPSVEASSRCCCWLPCQCKSICPCSSPG
ncbi:hypothetical protein CRG98_033528 [Punica granatum]|uniref:Uncharacterized protein n=1 Tax=Punica granatum TaxID=22663 RepID=A0A2I0IQT7_PUNGR|nr:hypothetical protein CRG98_033528 [Punica granatum]